MADKAKKKPYTLSISENVMATIDKEAEKDGRTRSDFAERLFQAFIKTKK